MQTSSLINHFDLQPQDVVLILDEFNKDIHDNIFLINYDYLVRNSVLIKFDKQSWNYRPDKFSNDYYENPYYYPIVLLVNNMGSFFEFRQDNVINTNIIAPKKKQILEILSKRLNI